MSKKQIVKIIFLLLFLVFVVFLLLKPYNQLCRTVNWCNPVSFSYLLPDLKGDKLINFELVAVSDYKNVDFKVVGEDSIVLKSGSKYTIDYEVINNSKKDIEVRPMRFFSNSKILDYLEFYECLCFQSHKIKAGEKKVLSVRFRLKSSIDKNDSFKDGDVFGIGYRMMME